MFPDSDAYISIPGCYRGDYVGLYRERSRANQRSSEVNKAEAKYSEKSRVNEGISGKDSCKRDKAPNDEE